MRPIYGAFAAILLVAVVLAGTFVGGEQVALGASVQNTTTSSTNLTGIGSLAWNSPSNGTTCSTSFTFPNDLDGGETTNYLKTVGYGFAIPAGSTIDGVTVSMRIQHGSNNFYATVNTRLIKNNVVDTSVTRSGLELFPGDPSVATITRGGATDTWGGLTVSDVNNANFGAAVYLEGSSNNMYPAVNCVSITVYYTTASGSVESDLMFFE